MSNLNKVQLIGRLGDKPELRYTQNQVAVCNFSLATSEKRKDASGQLVENTEWHKIVCWQRLAETSSTYLDKGRMCYVEGKLTTRSWEDNEGQKRYSTEIVANNIIFLGGEGQQKPATKKQTDEEPNLDDIPF